MKRSFAFFLTLLVFLTAAGCMTAPVVPPLGVIYSSVKAPIDADANPTAVTEKQGSASTQNILYLVAWGDASVNAAATGAGIKKVHHIDYDFFTVLGVYTRFTCTVYGE